MVRFNSTRLRLACGLALALLVSGAASSRPPPDVAARIQQLGRTIDPAATAKIYLPLQGTPSFDDVKVTRDIAYGPGAKNTFDLFLPARPSGGRLPVLVFIHGGGFVQGDKSKGLDGGPSPFYDNIMLWAGKNGLVGVNVNYSLAPGAQYPAVQREIGQMVDWIKTHADQYGADPDKIVLWGNSAGAAHLAAYVAEPKAPGVAGAILSSGTYDLTALDVKPGSQHPYFGDPATFAERNFWDRLLDSRAALMVTTNEWDPQRLIAEGEHLKAALCARRRCPTYAVIDGHGHVSATYAINTADQTMASPVLAFVRARTGGGPRRPR